MVVFGGWKSGFSTLHYTHVCLFILLFYYKGKSFSRIQNPTYSKIYYVHGNNGCNGDVEDFWHSIFDMWRFHVPFKSVRKFIFCACINFYFCCDGFPIQKLRIEVNAMVIGWLISWIFFGLRHRNDGYICRNHTISGIL